MSTQKELYFRLTIDGIESSISKFNQLENELKQVTAERNKFQASQRAGSQLNDTERSRLNELTARQSGLRIEINKLGTEIKQTNTLNLANVNTMAKVNAELGLARQRIQAMVVGSAEFKKTAQHIKELETKQRDFNAELGRGRTFVGEYGRGFQTAFTNIGLALGGITAALYIINKLTSSFALQDDQMADVRKTTGLLADEVKWLGDELEKINTRSSQEELLGLARVAGKLGISGKEDVLGFVKAADLINVALKEDLGGNVEEAVNKLGKLAEIFGLKKEFGIEKALTKVGSAINSIGAASTASEDYLVDFSARVGGVGQQANISLPNILAYGSVLDQLGQSAEISGTTMNTIWVSMFKNTASYAKVAKMSTADFSNLLKADANTAFIKFLEGLNGNNAGLSMMAQKLDALGIDGARAAQVLSALSGKTEMLRKEQSLSNTEFEKGDSLLKEFQIKNETFQATLDKVKKKFIELSVEVGSRLAHTIAAIGNLFGSLGGFISRNAGWIGVLVKSLGGLYAVVKLNSIISTVFNKILEYNTIAIGKLNAANIAKGITETKNISVTKLGILAQGAQTAATNIGTAATRLWGAAMNSLPIVAIIGGVVALASGISKLVSKSEEQVKLDKMRAEAMTQLTESVTTERKETDKLFAVAKSDLATKDEKLIAIRKLISIYPELLAKYKSEEGILSNLSAAQDIVNKKILESAIAKVKAKILEEKTMQLVESQIKIEKAKKGQIDESFWSAVGESAKNSFTSLKGFIALVSGDIRTQSELNAKSFTKGYQDENKVIRDEINQTGQVVSDVGKELIKSTQGIDFSGTKAGMQALDNEARKNNATLKELKAQYLKANKDEKDAIQQSINSYVEKNKQIIKSKMSLLGLDRGGDNTNTDNSGGGGGTGGLDKPKGKEGGKTETEAERFAKQREENIKRNNETILQLNRKFQDDIINETQNAFIKQREKERVKYERELQDKQVAEQRKSNLSKSTQDELIKQYENGTLEFKNIEEQKFIISYQLAKQYNQNIKQIDEKELADQIKLNNDLRLLQLSNAVGKANADLLSAKTDKEKHDAQIKLEQEKHKLILENLAIERKAREDKLNLDINTAQKDVNDLIKSETTAGVEGGSGGASAELKAAQTKLTALLDMEGQIRAEFNQKDLDAKQQAADAEDKIDDDLMKKRVDKAMQVGQAITSIMGSFNDIHRAKTEKQITDLEKAKDKEIKAAGKNSKKKEKIEAEYEAKIEKLKAEQNKKSQKIAIMQAGMQMALGIVNIWTGQATGNIIADAIIKGVMTAALVATTAAQIAQIKSQKFSKGGILQGASHSQGGIPLRIGGGFVEAEGGELIMTRGVMQNPALFQQASMINKMAGGVEFTKPNYNFAKPIFSIGGVIGSTPSISGSNIVVNNDNITLSNATISKIASAYNDKKVVNSIYDFETLQKVKTNQANNVKL